MTASTELAGSNEPIRILLADDDAIARRLLRAHLTAAGYDVVVAEDGLQAWSILESFGAPEIAILDWMMPGIDGVEICRRLRRLESRRYVYVLLVTARGRAGDVVSGLEAGADDYVTKPFDWEELRSRLRTGERVVRLKSTLSSKVEELEQALRHVRKLQGLLPICMHCKSIRDDRNTWHRIEAYIEKHSNAMFTHSLCRDCLNQHYPDYAEEETA